MAMKISFTKMKICWQTRGFSIQENQNTKNHFVFLITGKNQRIRENKIKNVYFDNYHNQV